MSAPGPGDGRRRLGLGRGRLPQKEDREVHCSSTREWTMTDLRECLQEIEDTFDPAAQGGRAKEDEPPAASAQAAVVPVAAPKNVLSLINGHVLPGVFVKQLGVAGQNENRLQHLYDPIGACVNEETGDILVADTMNQAVKIFNVNGTPLCMLTRVGRNPSALAVLYGPNRPEGEYEVVVKGDQTLDVFVYSPETAEFRKKGSLGMSGYNGPQFQYLYGLAVNKDGHIVVINNARETNEMTQILVIDPASGALVKALPYSGHLHGKPRFLCIFEEELIITDLGLNKVFIMDLKENGRLVKAFGVRGRNPGAFGFVSGVAVDGEGNMLIGDASNDRIQVFRKNGEYAGLVQIPGMPCPCPYPSGVYYDSSSRLILCSRARKPRGHIVNVIQL